MLLLVKQIHLWATGTDADSLSFYASLFGHASLALSASALFSKYVPTAAGARNAGARCMSNTTSECTSL